MKFLIKNTLPRLIIFIFVCISVSIFLGEQNSISAGPVTADIYLSKGSGTYAMPIDYSSFAFKWASNSTIEYSWDNVNFQAPTIAPDETGGEDDGFNYSYLISSQVGTLYLRGSFGSKVTLNLIPRSSFVQPAVGNTEGLEGQVNLASGANYTDLFIINRAAWGANELDTSWDPYYWEVDEIVVHHTVMKGTTNYAQVVRDIHYYHSITLGWGDIGYNYLIDPDGKIYEGRKGGESVIGAHTYNYNAGSIGIALIGDFTNTAPTVAALQSLENLMVERALINGMTLNWGSSVTGHKDHPQNSTACPGTALYALLPGFVTEAEQARVDLEAGEIATAREEMLTALATYPDVRLQLTFATPGLTVAQKRQLIPQNSGIKNIISYTGDTAVIEVESWSYYGSWRDDTYDRVKMLYLIFSLDPNFSGVDLLPGYVYLGSIPSHTKNLTINGKIQLLFSQEITAGTGNIEIRKVSDNTLVENLAMGTSKVVISDRHIELNPSTTFVKGVNYYVTVCATCVEDTANNAFAGFTTADTFQFRKGFKIETQSNYDGDNLSDIAIFDPPTAMWYVQRSGDDYYADPYIRAFGWSTVTPLTSGDYDGDGRTDIAIFDSENAHWYIQKSAQPANASPYFRPFGWRGVKGLASGDYDNDDKTDIAIFDPPTAKWFIQMSGQPANADPYIRAFGWSTAVPLVGGDYDGDGKTDIGIFDPGTVKWYIQMSGQPANADPYIRAFGWPGVKPVMGGDYDGDGKTDIGIYDPNSGAWYIQLSSLPANSSPIMRVLGGPGQIPLERGDYDGDGATDIGAYNPQRSEWTLLYSTKDFGGSKFVRRYGWQRVIPL